MRRTGLLTAVAAMLLAPMMMGFYPSCVKNSVGFYPNYPMIQPDGIPDHFQRTQTAASDSGIQATTLFVHFYDDYPGGPQSFYDNNCQRDDAAIAEAVETYLDDWSTAGGPNELNLNIVVPIHLPTGPTTMDVGPACKPYSDNPYSDPAFRNEFLAFVEVIGDVVSRPEYQIANNGVQVLLGVGNEVDLYLGHGLYGPPDSQKWTDFNAFVAYVMPRIRNNWAGLNPAFGTSVTWHSPSNNPDIGTFSVHNMAWSPAVLHIWDLALKTGSLVFTYYPFDVGNASHALDPLIPHFDLAVMSAFSRAIGTDPQNPWRVYIQEVGYPTHNELHTDVGGSPYSGGGNGQANQEVFVEAFFDAWELHKAEIRGASWWSLIDWWADPNELGCTLSWPEFQGNKFNKAMCTMGLFYYDANITTQPKQAWDTFKTKAQTVDGW